MEHEWTDLPVNVEDLPGIGRRYDMLGLDGGRLSVVIHRRSGEREISATGPDEEQAPAWVVRLTDEQARRAGSILGGAFFKTVPVEELETILSELTIDWVTVPAGSALAGRSIGEMAVRRRTGMTIMAIVRGHKVLTGPSSEDVVEPGDRLVIAGPREGLVALRSLLIDDQD
jgi:TrkA domain protein